VETDDLLQIMREEPSWFPTKAIKSLERASEFSLSDHVEIQGELLLASPLAERAVLEVVLELQKQVKKLAGLLQELRKNPPKRGFFGYLLHQSSAGHCGWNTATELGVEWQLTQIWPFELLLRRV
jgi:hypothetical protein